MAATTMTAIRSVFSRASPGSVEWYLRKAKNNVNDAVGLLFAVCNGCTGSTGRVHRWRYVFWELEPPPCLTLST